MKRARKRLALCIGSLAIAGLASGNLAAKAPPRLPPGDMVSYTAKAGDTLFSLARHYLVSPAAAEVVRRLNHLSDPRRIPVGRELTIPRDLLRYTPVTLRLASFSGPVTLGGAAPRVGQALVEQTTITTGPGGFALITGSDGSRLALPSNSTARIGRARHYALIDANDLGLVLSAGRSEVQAAHQQPQGRFRLETPIAVSAVRGTRFRASHDATAGVSTTGVTEGLVAVNTDASAVNLPAGQGAASARDGAIRQEALLPAPTLLKPGKVQTEPALAFRIAPQPGAARTHLQLARDAGFTDLLAETETTGPTATFPSLDNGGYFVRAAALAPSGIEGQAETFSFRRQRVGLKADVGQVAIPGAIRINWLVEGEGEARFRFQLLARGIIRHRKGRGRLCVQRQIAVHQHQHLVGREAAQLRGAHRVGAVGDGRAREVQRGQGACQRGGQFRGAGGLQCFRGDDVDR